jgi:hypothetical protein
VLARPTARTSITSEITLHHFSLAFPRLFLRVAGHVWVCRDCDVRFWEVGTTLVVVVDLFDCNVVGEQAPLGSHRGCCTVAVDGGRAGRRRGVAGS